MIETGKNIKSIFYSYRLPTDKKYANAITIATSLRQLVTKHVVGEGTVSMICVRQVYPTFSLSHAVHPSCRILAYTLPRGIIAISICLFLSSEGKGVGVHDKSVPVKFGKKKIYFYIKR